MSVVKVDDTAVVRGTVTFPLRGAWSASLVLTGTSAPAVGSSVTLSLGTSTFVGTVATSDKDAGNLVSVRLLGGRGGLGAQVSPQGYFAATVELLLTQALAVGSESISKLSDRDLLGTSLPFWSRYQGTVAEALVQIADVVGAMTGSAIGFRVLSDGSVWVGRETWAALELGDVVDGESPAEQWMTVALEAGTVLPGVTIKGRQIREVVYTVDEVRLRARLSYGERSGVDGLLAALVRRETQPLRLMGLATATVRSMNADGTVDVQPSDPKVPGLSHVPIRIAGVSSIKLLPGTGVLLGHEDGQNHKPAVVQVYAGPVQALSVEALESISLTAPSVKAGGELSLVLHDALQVWVAALTTAGLSVGLSVPALAAANTIILKGA